MKSKQYRKIINILLKNKDAIEFQATRCKELRKQEDQAYLRIQERVTAADNVIDSLLQRLLLTTTPDELKYNIWCDLGEYEGAEETCDIVDSLVCKPFVLNKHSEGCPIIDGE